MRRIWFTLVVVAALAATDSAPADHPGQGYPRVRTFSGGYYGPTQAHYQYQRRYGRPWHGAGGFSSYGHGHHYHGHGHSHGFGWPTYGYGSFNPGFGLPFASSGFGCSYFGGASLFSPGCGIFGFEAPPLVSYPLGVATTPPLLTLDSPGVYQPFWSNNPYVNSGLLNNGLQWQQEVPDLLAPQVNPLNVEPLGDAPVLPAPSTAQAQLRSLQQQQHGDGRLQQLDYLQAYLRYQQAAETAADRVEPHYRMGIALAGMKRFDKAVRELKRASDLDPGWMNAITLDELLGADNQIGKIQLKKRVADWALADAYDADRLYLLGTLLHLDGDADRARILIDTAVALVGNERHLSAFRATPSQPGEAGTFAPLPQDPAQPSETDPLPRREGPSPGPSTPQLPAPQADDVPEAPPAPSSTGLGAQPSPLEPSSPSQQPLLPSVPAPSGPVFPTSLN